MVHREILLVEDNPADQALCREAFAEIGGDIRLSIAGSAHEALRLLGERVTTGAPLPALILLDIQLPGTSGLDLLARLRADAHLGLLPVLMLTSSRHLSDVQEAYRLRANGYLVKPFDYEELRGLMARVAAFWLDDVLLPGAVQTPA